MELDKLCDKVQENSLKIVTIQKDLEVIPMKIDQVVGNHFEKYKEEKAKIKAAEAAKVNGNSKWYKNQYVLIASIVAFIQAATKLLEKYTSIIGNG